MFTIRTRAGSASALKIAAVAVASSSRHRRRVERRAAGDWQGCLENGHALHRHLSMYSTFIDECRFFTTSMTDVHRTRRDSVRPRGATMSAPGSRRRHVEHDRPDHAASRREGSRRARRRVRRRLLTRDDRAVHRRLARPARLGAVHRLPAGPRTPLRPRAAARPRPIGRHHRQGDAGGALRVRPERRTQPDGCRPPAAAIPTVECTCARRARLPPTR